LVVDHYGIDRRWEGQLRSDIGRIAVIDDLATASHDADLLVNLAFPEDSARYADLVTPGTPVFSGPSYALLDRSFREARQSHIETSQAGMAKRGHHLIAYFGGSDSTDLTCRTLRALLLADLEELEATFVLGSNYRQADAARALATSRTGLAVVPAQQSLAPLMSRSTIAIGAGGTSNWERLCMGIPSIVMALAPNQEASSTALGARNLIRYLGPDTEVTEGEIAAELAGLMSGRTWLRSDLGQALVDGRGALRVAELMDPTPEHRLRLRPANVDDVGQYYTWANDPEVRNNSFSPEPIPWEQHRVWFMDRITRKNCQMLVLEAQGLPVGQARVDFSGGPAELDYSIDPAFRGRGWGKSLIRRSLRAVRSASAEPITARVRIDNERSRSVLQSCGFRLMGSTENEVTLEFNERPKLPS